MDKQGRGMFWLITKVSGNYKRLIKILKGHCFFIILNCNLGYLIPPYWPPAFLCISLGFQLTAKPPSSSKLSINPNNTLQRCTFPFLNWRVGEVAETWWRSSLQKLMARNEWASWSESMSFDQSRGGTAEFCFPTLSAAFASDGCLGWSCAVVASE